MCMKKITTYKVPVYINATSANVVFLRKTIIPIIIRKRKHIAKVPEYLSASEDKQIVPIVDIIAKVYPIILSGE